MSGLSLALLLAALGLTAQEVLSDDDDKFKITELFSNIIYAEEKKRQRQWNEEFTRKGIKFTKREWELQRRRDMLEEYWLIQRTMPVVNITYPEAEAIKTFLDEIEDDTSMSEARANNYIENLDTAIFDTADPVVNRTHRIYPDYGGMDPDDAYNGAPVEEHLPEYDDDTFEDGPMMGKNPPVEGWTDLPTAAHAAGLAPDWHNMQQQIADDFGKLTPYEMAELCPYEETISYDWPEVFVQYMPQVQALLKHKQEIRQSRQYNFWGMFDPEQRAAAREEEDRATNSTKINYEVVTGEKPRRTSSQITRDARDDLEEEELQAVTGGDDDYDNNDDDEPLDVDENEEISITDLMTSDSKNKRIRRQLKNPDDEFFFQVFQDLEELTDDTDDHQIVDPDDPAYTLPEDQPEQDDFGMEDNYTPPYASLFDHIGSAAHGYESLVLRNAPSIVSPEFAGYDHKGWLEDPHLEADMHEAWEYGIFQDDAPYQDFWSADADPRGKLRSGYENWQHYVRGYRTGINEEYLEQSRLDYAHHQGQFEQVAWDNMEEQREDTDPHSANISESLSVFQYNPILYHRKDEEKVKYYEMTNHFGYPGTIYERTFVVMKPEAIQRNLIGELIQKFERKGLKLVGIKITTPTRPLAEAHYEELAGRPYHGAMCRYMSSGPVVAMVWEGRNAVTETRRMIGSLNPSVAEPGTIRGDYGLETGRNVIHAADGYDSARREISLWFQPAETVQYHYATQPWRTEIQTLHK